MSTRRRILIGLGVLAVLLAGGVAFVLLHEPGNVSNPDVAFEDEKPSKKPKQGKANGKQGKPAPKPDLVWPTYGYGPDRRRQVSVPDDFKPPFKRRWHYHAGGVLLEFPPVVSAKSLFILKDDGVVTAIDKDNGKPRWAKNVGNLAASTPHLDVKAERLYLTVLEDNQGGGGRAMAISTKSGNTYWSRDLPSRSESSPIVKNGLMYFGSEDGTVYALKTGSGAIEWTYQAAGAVKGGLALKDGKLFFGDYAGKVYAIRAANGKQVWQASTQGASFGFASGRFYATPAVAYGRVYAGNVDGYVYSFSEETGELAWRTQTGGYVYASPAVGSPPGGEPTVYAGSYDGVFYALDARSGSVRWTYSAGGRISGPSTLLGDIVYFGNIETKKTLGLDARTGKRRFEFPRGGYATVVTDRDQLFLVGYGGMYGLKAKAMIRHEKRARKQASRTRKRAGKARKRATRDGD